MRWKVSNETKLPGNWMDFLRDPINKRELFAFLTSKIEDFNLPPAKAVYVTSEKSVTTFGTGITMQNCQKRRTPELWFMWYII